MEGISSHYLAGGVQGDRQESEAIGRHIPFSDENALNKMERELNSPSWLMVTAR